MNVRIYLPYVSLQPSLPPPLSLSLSEHMDAFVSLVEEEHKAVIPHYIKVM